MTSTVSIPTRTAAPAATLSPTAPRLAVFALACQGLAVRLRLREHGVCDSRTLLGTRPRLSITLRRPVPLAHLVVAIDRFNATGEDACLLLARSGAAQHAYAEHLHVAGAGDHVVRVERRFVPRAASDEQDVVGLILRLPTVARNRPRPSHARLLRNLRRRMRQHDITPIELPQLTEAAVLPPDADALDQLTPSDLPRLAALLGFIPCGDGCYADPAADVSANALLRGPLLVTRRHVGPQEIHVGPAIVTDDSGPVSILARSASPDVSIDEPANARTATIAAPEYFTGPVITPRPFYELFKRLFDVIFAAAALALLSPLMVLAAIAIKLYDRGPVFFVHQREGLDGRPFGCIKFRTMRTDAERLKRELRCANQVDGPQFKIASDPRITPIGRFLRKTNVDELPQFWNVLRGEMSIVGPRPSPFEENQLCPPWREARLSVKPGITGLWQVSRSEERGAADFQEWILYDTQYVERRCFWLDVKIILLTIKQILGKGQ